MTTTWADVNCDEYGQITCPIPGCEEELHLRREYAIPLIAEQEPDPGIDDAISDYWEVRCIGRHTIYTSWDHARATGGDETSETAVEYDHVAVHKAINALWGERL